MLERFFNYVIGASTIGLLGFAIYVEWLLIKEKQKSGNKTLTF